MEKEPRPAAESQPEWGDDPLVAYLDGELSPQVAGEIERRLAGDPELRRRLSELQQSWDALDSLPQASTAGTFTRSTIEMVAREASRELRRTRRSRPGTWILRWSAVALAVACGWAGFLAVRGFQTAEARQLARDLRVIENLDLYRAIDSVDFLQQLEQSGLFAHEEDVNE